MDIAIGGRKIGGNAPCYIIAEMSANHNGDIAQAKEIIKRAKESGADAVKIQTYTPDTITIDCGKPDFQITQGTIWDGVTLYELYKKAYTPFEWHAELFETAKNEGITIFSSPFDLSAVLLLEKLDAPAYKIASFEINDIPLIKRAAATKKPIILSTGIARLSEIEEAVSTVKNEGNEQIALLKCTSAYPAPLDTVNLRTIPHMEQMFGVVAGISDHTTGHSAVLGAVALGAKIIEKHFTLDGKTGVDSAFSMEPRELAAMIKAVRELEAALGSVSYELTEKQMKSREHSRSVYVVEDMKKGEAFTERNIRSIRPAYGLHTRYLDCVLGKTASCDIEKGTPLKWEFITSE